MSRRHLDDQGELSTAEMEMLEAKIPDRMAFTEAAYNAGARLADDHFCQCCGKRGVIGRYCRTCEESGR